jgi:hypothetical protein
LGPIEYRHHRDVSIRKGHVHFARHHLAGGRRTDILRVIRHYPRRLDLRADHRSADGGAEQYLHSPIGFMTPDPTALGQDPHWSLRALQSCIADLAIRGPDTFEEVSDPALGEWSATRTEVKFGGSARRLYEWRHTLYSPRRI